MHIPCYHVDTFTDKIFAGNPAMVCVLPKWLPDALLQKIAIENNLPATAFLLRDRDGFSTRWFAPEYEIDLCGHGSLASGYVIFNILEPSWHEVNLYHPQAGTLQILHKDSFITLQFPVKPLEECSVSSALLKQGLGKEPKEIYQYKNERILAVFETEDDIKQMIPDIELLKKLDHRGIIVTAPGKEVDFVSRVFYPKKAMYEDAMTGSSYCLLIPYWHKQFNKIKFHAKQISKRGGEVIAQLNDNSVLLNGKAVLFNQGTIQL